MGQHITRTASMIKWNTDIKQWSVGYCTFAKHPSSVLSQLLAISYRVGYKRVIKPICVSSAWFKCSTFSESRCDFLISLRWQQIMETGFLVQYMSSEEPARECLTSHDDCEACRHQQSLTPLCSYRRGKCYFVFLIIHDIKICLLCFYRAMHFSAKRSIAIACRLSVSL